jgi:hypothetical protein
MMIPADVEKFDELTLRYLHGVASDADRLKLGEMLREDDACRVRFIEHMGQHAMLCDEAQAGSLASDKVLYFEQLAGTSPRRSWPRRAWLAVAAVASMLLVTVLLLRPTDAMAALEKVTQVAEQALTRCYGVRVLEPGDASQVPAGRGPYPPSSHLEGAVLWMKGPGKFALKQQLPNGEMRLFGGNQEGSWTMRGTGPVRVSPDPTRFGRATLSAGGDVAFIDVRSQLSQIRSDYDLSWLPDATDGTRRLLASRQRPATGGPKEIELWFDPSEAVLRKMILRQLPKGQGGPRSLELTLLSVDPLPDEYFRHDYHHAPDRPVILEP